MTILQRVNQHVLDDPHRLAFVFLGRNNRVESSLTWFELWESAQRVASTLKLTREPSEFGVMIFCQNEANFIIALLAIWIRGATAIPAAGGLYSNMFERNRHILDAGSPDLVLHDHNEENLGKLNTSTCNPTYYNIYYGLAQNIVGMVPEDSVGGGLVQFTSGSTSDPKAVKLTPKNIAENCSAIKNEFGLGIKTVGVHWLPMHHDMGLVGSVLVPLWSGALSIILKPSSFIQRPLDWLKAISHWHGTITSAPNFAFAKLIKDVDKLDISFLELKSLETVIFGGESIRKNTIDRFIQVFGVCGLDPAVIAPCYGLAEVTLLASSGKNIHGPKFDDSVALRPVANVGKPTRNLSVQIIDPKNKKECVEREIGLIRLTGSSVGVVVKNGENWRSYGENDTIQTSDLGYVDNGFLYITGRSTNKIIIRGKNIYAEDVENLVLGHQLDPNIIGVVAFAVVHKATESLCLLIEEDRGTKEIDINIIYQRVGRRLGVKVSNIVILKRNTLPRTSSGKIQRDVARKKFMLGAFEKRIIKSA